MIEAMRALLGNCTTCDPPFNSLIKSTLSSLETSRFLFAIELQKTLDASRNSLDPVQIICILCTLHCIGGNYDSSDADSPSSTSNQNQKQLNAFSGFLQKYHADAVSIMSEINSRRDSNLSLPLLEEMQTSDKDMKKSGNEINMTHSTTTMATSTSSMPKFYRPLPPLSTITNRGDPANLNLHFLHSSFPSLRYEWLQPEDPKPSTGELLDKIFHAPLEHEEEKALLLYCRQKGIIPTSSKEGDNGKKDGSKYPILTPENLPVLVQHNPNVAIILLLSLEPAASSPQTQLYHSALVRMDITLHTMEVVYKLATNRHLRTEDLHIFVLSLFERCTKMEGGGTATGATSTTQQGLGDGSISVSIIRNDRKMVRLVSVFLQNLISNGLVEDFVEVQAFCIQNSRVREANALYKLIKDMGGKGSSSSSVSSKGGKKGNKGGRRR